jgi:hypothetical protein
LITADQWYDSNADLTSFYQGDVITGVPYAFWPQINSAKEATVWGILRPLKQAGRALKDVLSSLPTELIGRAAKDVADAWNLPEGEYVVAGCRKIKVMIISRSCTLDNPKRKHFLVAPIQAVEDLPPEQRSTGKLQELRQNGIPHFFYLPSKEGLPESYSDLLRMEPVHRSFFNIEILKTNLAARLSATATDALQMALSDHFGKQFGFDHKDTCPQDGDYSCSNCFHLGMPVERKRFDAQSLFGLCERCGEDAAWVKLPAL